MHTCGWFPNGKARCSEPATKCVRFSDSEMASMDDDGSPLFDVIWLCDRHYQDESLVEFWRKIGVKPMF